MADTNGRPVHLTLTPGATHGNQLYSVLLSALLIRRMLIRITNTRLDQGTCRPEWRVGRYPTEARNRKDAIRLGPVSIPRAT
jgi:hypothetical protein